jgi:glyoxalase family protein
LALGDDSGRRDDDMAHVHGLHHITCISGDPQENLNLYTELLGLRLVKRSINQDAPDTYHFFYADAEGHPGTDLTFFPWPKMPPGRLGTGLAVEVGFAVPEGTLGWWAERLESAGIEPEAPASRFGETVLRFQDPHGLALSLTENEEAKDFTPWEHSPVAESHQIRGFHTVRLWERDLATTARFVEEALGLEAAGEDAGWHRYGAAGGGSGRWLEIRELPDQRLGAWGVGSVHHVAFRVRDEEEQLAVRTQAVIADALPTQVIDRFWFKSVYFREPGGVLFELATEEPGFTADEELEHLGESLVLPPWFESKRAEIEAALPPVKVPVSATSA